jgi:hypothetical protein
MNFFLKKYKKNKILFIEKNYRYLFLFRYSGLDFNNMLLLKKKLENSNYFFYKLKNNLLEKRIKGQGSIIYIYTNNNILIYLNILFSLFFLNFIFFKSSFLFSKLKFEKINFSIISDSYFIYNIYFFYLQFIYMFINLRYFIKFQSIFSLFIKNYRWV